MYSFNTWTNPMLTAFAQGRNSPVNEYTDNLTKIHGNHTFKFGGNSASPSSTAINDAGIYPNERLSTAHGNTPQYQRHPGRSHLHALTTFQGMYNDLLGPRWLLAQKPTTAT